MSVPFRQTKRRSGIDTRILPIYNVSLLKK
jgi:hypothetical protein